MRRHSAMLRPLFALLALGTLLVGCAREPVYVSDSAQYPQPTPDRTVDAIVRGLASPVVAGSPLPTVVAPAILVTMAARQVAVAPTAAAVGASAGPGRAAAPAAAPAATVAPIPTSVLPRPTVRPPAAAVPTLAPAPPPPTATAVRAIVPPAMPPVATPVRR